MKPFQEKIDRFKTLAAKRKGGLLEPAEEEEYRRLGRELAQQKRDEPGGRPARRTARWMRLFR